MKIHIIVAMTSDRVIGYRGRLPWDIPKDLQLFRQYTLNNTVLMGKNTYSGIGHPLSQRNNIVISRTLPTTDELLTCDSFSEGIELAEKWGKDIYCIGGEEIYRQALPIADFLHISWVEQNYKGDCFFPEFNMDQWHETSRNEYAGFTQCSYARKNRNAPSSEHGA